jgi:hypothetical protein
MSTDKKWTNNYESSGSASSLPLFSPVVDKEECKSMDFSAAEVVFPSAGSLESDPQ